MIDLATFLKEASKPELEFLLAGARQKLAEKKAVLPSAPTGGAFQIPEGTKHLTAGQLDEMTASFAEWYDEARNPAQKRSRARLYLAFLLIRYGALRLGEVLAIDDQTDFRFSSSQVVIHGAHKRRVLLPRPVMDIITELLRTPMFFSLRGQVFKLDQGYLRRKFYERARACGMQPQLFNPRTIRHSRAIELLCGGVPLQVAQSFLGQQNLNMTASFLEFSGDAVQNIVRSYIAREGKMKTSARNSFTGRVSHITRDGLMVEVELTTMAGLRVVAVITDESLRNLGLAEGSIATAIIKAPWVFLSTSEKEYSTSARNRFPGIIAEIKNTAVACEVVTDLADGTKICALVTRESVEQMNLRPGLEIQVMFKAFSVIINVE